MAQHLFQTSAAGWGLSALALGLVWAQLVWVLPRLRREAGVAASVMLVFSIAAVAALLWWQLSVPVGWTLPVVVALAFGHVGWSLGRKQPRRPDATVTRAPSSTLSAPRSTLPAQADRGSLGRYRIERELGRGAMGAVYLGRDPKIGRQVAIKTMALSREFAGDELVEARERFFREAETAGRLQHPDIVTIFDAGEERELAYIAMEYLKGDNLQAYTTPAKLLPVANVLLIVARVADALHYAHSQGVVHRDIKPANVVVDPATDQVKVTDFGIARVADSARTRTGLVLGTPSFMSPEQLAGRRVDGRSDLYSLGVMLFQLLTGRLPHRSESMATLMQQIANEPAPDVRSIRPDLPEALARVVALTLEKRPEARYSGGQQLAADLRAVVASMKSHGQQPGPVNAAALPPDSSGFAATVKMERVDTGHNPSL
ncbi:serine/threonine-protein kinase [Piscinibacter gummiphilus]|uniref:Serine/threonine-protein kinase n=1 Tax=Piscinibacter gummiphilus TaxID=946333 RepID=A0ABZ0D1P9_9BURK|nr:serine/threonine-protein kinase [Piscinibacter gummiphilus]WOB11102.1 serine/threonine-protein kinase [Piscinibacter gummiphilus]